MNHDDAIPDSRLDLPMQPAKLTTTELVTDIELAIEQVKSPSGALAPTEPLSQQPPKQQTLPTSPVVDSFLPSPNRLLIFGGLGLVSLLGISAIASNFIPHTTSVKVQALIEPVGETQPVQSGSGGVVETISVQEHQPIQAGEVITSFKNPELQAEIFQAERKIAGVEEQINQTDGQIAALERRRSAESTWLQQLTTEGLSAQDNRIQFENSKTQLLAHRSKLDDQLEQEQQQLKQLQQQQDNLTIRSPKEGTIYNLTVTQPRQTVGPDVTIAEIIPNEVDLEIKALVADTAIETIEVGHPTQMRLSECPAFQFGSLHGQIRSIAPVQPAPDDSSALAAPQQHTVTVNNNMSPLQAGSRTCELLPGMQGELTIIVKQEKLLNFLLRKLRLQTNS